jgi:hypothetical protein
MSLFSSSVISGIGRFFQNYGGTIAVGGLSIIGVRSYVNNVERDYQQKQCDVFREYMRNMTKINGNLFSKEDAFDRLPHLRRFHEYCDCNPEFARHNTTHSNHGIHDF